MGLPNAIARTTGGLCRNAAGRALASLFAFGLFVSHGLCAGFAVSVVGEGKALEHAVVTLRPLSGTSAPRPLPATMDQRDLQFTPRVMAVPVGSRVRFPNSDDVRHQVYSFSPAKRFELPLYSGKQAPAVLFDAPGLVELGCNIHDWMAGFILVTDAPYFLVTRGDGRAAFDVPPGSYRLEIWHERRVADGSAMWAQTVRVDAAGGAQRVELKLSPAPAANRPQDERLRRLQEKFRAIRRDE